VLNNIELIGYILPRPLRNITSGFLFLFFKLVVIKFCQTHFFSVKVSF